MLHQLEMIPHFYIVFWLKPVRSHYPAHQQWNLLQQQEEENPKDIYKEVIQKVMLLYGKYRMLP